MMPTLITPKILIVMMTFSKAALNSPIQGLLWLWTSISLGKVQRTGWLAPVVGGSPPRAAVTNPQRASALKQQECIFSAFSGWKCKVEVSPRLWGGPFWPLPLLRSLSIPCPASTPPVSASTVPLLPPPCFRLLRMLTSDATLLGYPGRAPLLKVLSNLSSSRSWGFCLVRSYSPVPGIRMGAYVLGGCHPIHYDRCMFSILWN